MTTITSSSTMAEVVENNPAVDLIDDISAWNLLVLPRLDSFTGYNTVYLGLFGADLTDFFTDCALATACDYDSLV